MVRHSEYIFDRIAFELLIERQHLLSDTQLFSASDLEVDNMCRTNWILDSTASVKRKQIADISVEGVEKRVLPNNAKKFYVSTISY